MCKLLQSCKEPVTALSVLLVLETEPEFTPRFDSEPTKYSGNTACYFSATESKLERLKVQSAFWGMWQE